MVSSAESGGVGFGVVDGRPGTIVWVRRRNGSWWPGRILGPEDLSASHLMSPRSGTPVKLLGREDASVDWYNLEKSKRVKAFRCGEFDDCIERASASQGLPAKKREKYARREDAILHALELEKKFLDSKPAKSVKPKKSSESERKLSVPPVRALENGNGRLGHHDSTQPGRRPADKSKLMDKNGGLPLLSQKPKDLEDHGSLISSHVRGLQDYNYKAVPLRMLYSNASEDSNRTAPDAHAYPMSGSDPAFQNSSDSDSRNSFGKGKRLHEAYIDDSMSKRQRVFHPLVSLRQNSADLPNHSLPLDMYANRMSGDGVRCSVYTPTQSSQMFSSKQNPQGQMDMPFHRPEPGTHHRPHATFPEETASGSSEETESDSSETHSIEPHVESGMLFSDAETRMPAQPRLCDRLQAGQESTSGDESDENSLDDRSQFHYLDQNASGAEVSKWQLKGKRNVRNLGKRPMDSCSQRTNFDARGRPLNQRATSHSLSYYHDNGFANDADFSEDEFDLPTNGFGQRGYLPSQAAARRQSYIGSNVNDWDLVWGRPFRGYWEERGAWLSPMFIGGNGHDMLIDVDLTVQANRQGEHVPWVSLMSKLNGKAIIGHPIQIETLEDGSTDFLLSMSEEFRYDSDRCKVPPVWRTARRTANVRVPRPQQLDVDEDTDYQHLHQSGKVRSKKSFAPSTVRKGSLSKITQSYVSRSPEGVKKAPRKGNLPSNQKTKPLSSIGFDQKVPIPNKASDDDSGYYMDGVIKPVESGPPTVACIPVKLAFSRLLEAVGRQPSGAAKHGVSVNSNKERNPS